VSRFERRIWYGIVIEVQVRVEEEHLHALHGHEYGEYLTHTGRYSPKWKRQ
jgi:protein-S-isoprenylcysteine O-methyltransferase Ste14